ncbi:MAG: hypothetical protein HQL71_05600 [Magnetococcales bacterium]|nr:hypothetical protein [Magnetococcales bacterium]
MTDNKLTTKQSSFLVTAEFVLTNKQVVIGLFSLGPYDTISEFLQEAEPFIVVSDRKKKNPDTIIKTDQIVTIRELDRKEVATKKLNL